MGILSPVWDYSEIIDISIRGVFDVSLRLLKPDSSPRMVVEIQFGAPES